METHILVLKVKCVWFFVCAFADNAIAERQLTELEQIAALPMSMAESKTIKPLIETMNDLLREWISANKDVKGDSYALRKMMVFRINDSTN